MTHGEGLTLSMPAIAELAGVQRAVVSMWRTRYRNGELPFPEPVDPDAPLLRFRAVEVADWIEQTTKGNNPEFRADLAVRAALPDDGDPTRSLEVLTALLAVAAHAPVPLDDLDAETLVDLADAVDPEDAFAYREIAALGPVAVEAARHASAVASAAYNPANAIETLLGARHRLADTGLTASVLRPAVLTLVADVLSTLVPPEPELVVADPHPGCGDLLAAVLGRAERVDPVAARVSAGDDPVHRLARRRLVAHGWPVGVLEPDDEAHLVTQVPALGEADLDVATVLDRLDDVALTLPAGKVGIVVGPAAALVDELKDRDAERVRDTMLRSGRVRSVILLPPGLVTSRPRQKTALWVFGDVTPGASFAEQHLVVADLSDHAPDGATFAPDVVADLLTDVVAAQGTLRDAASHHFRFARFLRPSEIVAGSRSLLGAAQAVTDLAPPDPAGAVQRLEALTAELAEALPLPPLPGMHTSPEGSGGGRSRIDQLDGRAVRRLAGHRLRADDVRRREGASGGLTEGPSGGPDGTVPVVGAGEVLGDLPWGARRIGRLRFAEAYPAGRFTEPGDVVFVASPRPAARVDVEGFSVVESPARILRVADGARDRLVPEVIAADICAAGDDARRSEARDPGAWVVRGVPAGQGESLDGALAVLRAHEEALRARLAVVAELRSTLMDGVAAGVIRLDVSGPREDARTMREEG